MDLKLTNNNYCGTVVQITKVILLDNCDNVQHANIFGNLVIVSKDTKVGDMGIYFPVECKLSNKFLKNNNLYRHKEKNINPEAEKPGYFEDNGRIKAVKFRGHASNGLFLELDSLDFIDESLKDKLEVGQEFNEINKVNICKKYVIKRNVSGFSKGKKAQGEKLESKILDGQFRLHYDTDQLGKNIFKLKPDDIISITEKYHGTSAIVGKVLVKKRLNLLEKLLKLLKINVIDSEYGMLYSSRRVIKNEYFNSRKISHFYDSDVWKETADKIYPFLFDGMTVYYEIVGYTSEGSSIQGKYDYGCEVGKNEIYIYRITYTNTDGKVFEFSARQVQQWCETNGFKAVEEHYYGYAKHLFSLDLDHEWNNNFLENLKQRYLEGDCLLCKNKVQREGIVLKTENGQPEAYKLKSFRFLQQESKDLDKGIVTLEDEN